jgi:hypothetical protein
MKGLVILRVRPGCVAVVNGVTHYAGIEFTTSAPKAAELEAAGLVDRQPIPEQWQRRLPRTEEPAAA